MREILEKLFQQEELHEEIVDNNIKYVIDVEKGTDNEINITVTKEQVSNKDKEQFEAWVNQLDDNLFSEIWESLSEDYGLYDLNKLYESEDYKKVIDLFKERTQKILSQKIEKLTKLIPAVGD